ncbi:MAG: hypothetical protein V1728_01975 [Candidatus Micrarchaeota archaeon]
MDEQLLIELAQEIGLGLAVTEFRGEVVAAAREAEKHRRALHDSFSPSDEPWPPMQVRKT